MSSNNKPGELETETKVVRKAVVKDQHDGTEKMGRLQQCCAIAQEMRLRWIWGRERKLKT